MVGRRVGGGRAGPGRRRKRKRKRLKGFWAQERARGGLARLMARGAAGGNGSNGADADEEPLDLGALDWFAPLPLRISLP